MDITETYSYFLFVFCILYFVFCILYFVFVFVCDTCVQVSTLYCWRHEDTQCVTHPSFPLCILYLVFCICYCVQLSDLWSACSRSTNIEIPRTSVHIQPAGDSFKREALQLQNMFLRHYTKFRDHQHPHPPFKTHIDQNLLSSFFLSILISSYGAFYKLCINFDKLLNASFTTL